MQKIGNYFTRTGWQKDLNETIEDTCLLVRSVVKFSILGYLAFQLGSTNGVFDSLRTKDGEDLADPSDPIKTVSSVVETWKDTVPYSPDGTGFNPRVIREISFEDGTHITLDYRVLVWQPLRKWIHGEEFNPQVGQKYEISPRYGFIALK